MGKGFPTIFPMNIYPMNIYEYKNGTLAIFVFQYQPPNHHFLYILWRWTVWRWNLRVLVIRNVNKSQPFEGDVYWTMFFFRRFSMVKSHDVLWWSTSEISQNPPRGCLDDDLSFKYHPSFSPFSQPTGSMYGIFTKPWMVDFCRGNVGRYIPYMDPMAGQ